MSPCYLMSGRFAIGVDVSCPAQSLDEQGKAEKCRDRIRSIPGPDGDAESAMFYKLFTAQLHSSRQFLSR